MIHITKIVDNQLVNEKLDLDLLQGKLPSIEEEISITLVATKKERKPDAWKKEGCKYYRIILNYDEVISSSKENVMELMKNKTIETIFP